MRKSIIEKALLAVGALALAGVGVAAASPVGAGECSGPDVKLVPPAGSDFDEYGHAVAVSEDVLVVGARFDGVVAGAGYVYRYDRDAMDWGVPTKLTPGGPGDQVGFAVAASPDVVVLSARRDRENGIDAGAIYVYRYDHLSMSWGAPVKLAPGITNDQVGFSVAASGDIVVAGAKGDDDSGVNAGAAYVWRYDHAKSSWGTPVKLTPGVDSDEVGWSVAADGDVVVVGAHLDDDSGLTAGAAYIYRYDGMDWGAPLKLTPGPPDCCAIDEFGHAVAVSGDVVVVGSRQDDDTGIDAGATYVYRYDNKTMMWGAPEKFTPAIAGDDFGWAVAAWGDQHIVGAYTDAIEGADAGAVYIYDYDSGTMDWGSPSTLRPAMEGDQFGYSTALTGEVMAVGARFDGDSGEKAGAVYVFGCPNVAVTGDLDGNGIVNFADIVVLLGAWGPCDGCLEDLDGNGMVAFADLLILLANWT